MLGKCTTTDLYLQTLPISSDSKIPPTKISPKEYLKILTQPNNSSIMLIFKGFKTISVDYVVCYSQNVEMIYPLAENWTNYDSIIQWNATQLLNTINWFQILLNGNMLCNSIYYYYSTFINNYISICDYM
jgi:hypothetical protein